MGSNQSKSSPPHTPSVSVQSLSEELTCCICCEIYSDPVTLRCGHNFCRGCIEGLRGAAPLGGHLCPECRQPFDWGSIASDFRMKNMVQKVREAVGETTEASPVVDPGLPGVHLQHPANLLKPVQKFFYREVEGDILTCPKTDSMVIGMNRKFRMESGVGKLFKERFGSIDELKLQGKGVGEVAVLPNEGRYIYYMITRNTFAFKPSYEDLGKCLQALRCHCTGHNVRSLSMPRIGTGRDQLDWTVVSQLIRGIFQDTRMRITVYSFSQNRHAAPDRGPEADRVPDVSPGETLQLPAGH